jgi:phosphoglycolate phosphatase
MFDAVFDLDGTLVDSVQVCVDILNQMLRDRESDKRVGVAQARKYMSVGGESMISALLGEDSRNAARDLAEFRSRYVDHPTPVESVFDGVRKGLRRLRSDGVRLSICSAKPQNLCEKLLEEVGLASHFALIVGRSPDRPCKPDRGHYDYVLQKLGGKPERSCLIGDSEQDYALAERAGAPFVFVTWGYADQGFAPQTAMRVDQFDAIPPLVSHMRAQRDIADEAIALQRIAG